MEHLSTWKETEGGKVLTMGKEAIQQGETINSEVELRDRLIDLVSVGNLKHKPEALFTLFRQFLTRISLPRLIHFLDRGRRKDPLELSPYQVVAGESVCCHPTGANLVFLLLP